MYSSTILEKVKPKFVFMLGDILYDGPGQEYVINKSDENYDPLVKGRLGVKKLSESKFIVLGNSYFDPLIKTLHERYFLEFLEACDEYNVERAYILTGNHDYDVNYEKIVKRANIEQLDVKTVKEYSLEDIEGMNILMLSYNFLKRETLLRILRLLCESEILMTHGRLGQLRMLTRLLYKYSYGTKLIVSGHSGYGYYPPESIFKALVSMSSKLWNIISTKSGSELYPELCCNRFIHLARIDSFPRSFLVMDISNKAVRGKILGKREIHGKEISLESEFKIMFEHTSNMEAKRSYILRTSRLFNFRD